jgi:hypothetical protein
MAAELAIACCTAQLASWQPCHGGYSMMPGVADAKSLAWWSKDSQVRTGHLWLRRSYA